MRFSLFLPSGFTHEFADTQGPRETQFEAWSTITALAGHTTRVRLGLLVASVGYRSPALAAKIASTVDVISNGRLVFGLGAGWPAPIERPPLPRYRPQRYEKSTTPATSAR